jgi:hypothetical protein
MAAGHETMAEPSAGIARRVFVLSPANCRGKRASQVLAPGARFALAERLRSPGGAALGEVFAHVSGLYFRGKLTYARRFARPPAVPAVAGAYVITPNAGLLEADVLVTRATIQSFAGAEIDAASPAYRRPLERSARALAAAAGADCEIVLLGSIATPKYVDALLDSFGSRLTFPVAFVGRGDMSRGGLLLRAAADGSELEYAPVAGAARHGPRPPKLAPTARYRPFISS